MATPDFVSAGAVGASVGTFVPGAPNFTQDGDVLLLFIATASQNVTVSGGNQTWTEVTNSPQSVGSVGSSGAQLTVFWARRGATSPTMPTVGDSGNHQMGIVLAFRSCTSSGVPYNVTAGDTESGDIDTSGSIPGATTTAANTLIVAAIATALPDSSTSDTNLSGWTNANLGSLTERADETTSSGNGSGLGVATGTYAGPGDYGTTSVTTSTNTAKAMMSIALVGESITVSGGIATSTESSLAGTMVPGAVTISGGISLATESSLAGTVEASSPQTVVGGISASVETALDGATILGVVTVPGAITISTETALAGSVIAVGAPQTVIGGIASETSSALAQVTAGTEQTQASVTAGHVINTVPNTKLQRELDDEDAAVLAALYLLAV